MGSKTVYSRTNHPRKVLSVLILNNACCIPEALFITQRELVIGISKMTVFFSQNDVEIRERDDEEFPCQNIGIF